MDIKDKDKFIEDLYGRLKGLREDLKDWASDPYGTMGYSQRDRFRMIDSIIKWMERYQG